MKKLITIILLLITVQYTFGLYAVYVLNSRVVKQNMRHAIAEGSFLPQQVTYITVSLHDFTEAEYRQWQQHEIQYQGKMYDIIKTYHQDRNLVVQCICDDDENNLTASFLNTMHKAGQFPGKKVNPLDNLFSPFILDDSWHSANRFVHINIPYIQKPVAFASKGFQYVPAPPPWQV